MDLERVAQYNGRFYRRGSGEPDERGGDPCSQRQTEIHLPGGYGARHLSRSGIGAEKKSRVISEKEKRITAYHESGHAILFHLLPDVGPVHTVSIIPTGVGAAGYTMPLPEKDEMFHDQQEDDAGYHGVPGRPHRRGADLRGCDDWRFPGYSSQATKTARAMVTQYGMSDRIGMIKLQR